MTRTSPTTSTTTSITPGPTPARRRLARLAVTLLAVLAVTGSAAAAVPPRHATPSAATARHVADTSAFVPPVGHLFVVVIENKDYERAWGPGSEAPYLATTLRRKGVLLNSYYGTAHNSQPNYVAMVSGQGPTPEMQGDCQNYRDFTGSGTVAPGQYVGQGCVFPRAVPTLTKQLDRSGHTWRGYMQDMGRSCRHPALNTQDHTQQAQKGDQYAARHDPFVYFHSVIDRPRYCQEHVVDLRALPRDLQRVRSTRNLSYIVPNLCADGHDDPCVNGKPGGLVAVDRWMKRWVPKILASPAFGRNGALLITSDESDGPQSDATACCHEQPGPNSPDPGIVGPGGGRIGALVISPRWVQRNSWSTTPYNHYSLLGSIEDVFGVAHLGFAKPRDVHKFGRDVWNAYHP